MASGVISQREARRLRKRVEELEKILVSQRSCWVADYPRGTNILTMTDCHRDFLIGIRVARRLGHAVVVTETETGLRFYALPHPKEDV